MKIIDFTIGRKKNGRVVNTTIYHPKKLPDDNKLKSTYFGIGSKRIGITFIYIKANGEARSIKELGVILLSIILEQAVLLIKQKQMLKNGIKLEFLAEKILKR